MTFYKHCSPPMALVVVTLSMINIGLGETIISFDDYPLDRDGVFNGPVSNATTQTRNYWWRSQQEQVGTFDVEEVGFSNSSAAASWTGFSVSNNDDVTTASSVNQYSAFPGAGSQGSPNFSVGFGYRDTVETTYIGSASLLDPSDPVQLRELPSWTAPLWMV